MKNLSKTSTAKGLSELPAHELADLNEQMVNLLQKRIVEDAAKCKTQQKIMSYNILNFDNLCNKSKVFARLMNVKLEQFHEIVRKVHLQQETSFWKIFQDKKLN